MNIVNVCRNLQPLAGKSPAGRTFASEFAKLQEVQNDVQREIEKRLSKDAEFQLLVESGVFAMARFSPDFFTSGHGKTPVGMLRYSLRMPDGTETGLIAKAINIHLALDGTPIFRVNAFEFRKMETAAMIMAVAIRNLLL